MSEPVAVFVFVFVFVFGLLKMRIVIEKLGWCLSISLPSSTMEIRWPLPGEGYRTMASSIFTNNKKRRMVPRVSFWELNHVSLNL